MGLVVALAEGRGTLCCRGSQLLLVRGLRFGLRDALILGKVSGRERQCLSIGEDRLADLPSQRWYGWCSLLPIDLQARG